jgi:hypothetical protein
MSRYSATRTGWPRDQGHDYALWLDRPTSRGLHSAYVTARPKDGRGGTHSRFAVRLDLPGEYSSKANAQADAFYVANKFYRRKFAAHECEVSATVKAYLITARARFRIDCHEWEPVLWIKSTRCPTNKDATQAFDGIDSPFHKTTFPTAETAARFALSYGERLALGLVGGLHI